jgi:hypothetical protein
LCGSATTEHASLDPVNKKSLFLVVCVCVQKNDQSYHGVAAAVGYDKPAVLHETPGRRAWDGGLSGHQRGVASVPGKILSQTYAFVGKIRCTIVGASYDLF